MYRLNVLPIKILEGHFVNLVKFILNIIGETKDPVYQYIEGEEKKC
jgi:hypothetical protein